MPRDWAGFQSTAIATIDCEDCSPGVPGLKTCICEFGPFIVKLINPFHPAIIMS
jgi:hypothetical protein